MTATHDSILKVDRRSRIFDSSEQRSALVEAYQSSGAKLAITSSNQIPITITLMGCHAHVRRKFFEAQDQSPRLVAWILRQLAHLNPIEKRLRETHTSPVLRETIRAWQSRPTKLGAKNWLFIGREYAVEKSAILYTLVENYRRLGINPRNYFEDVLTRLPAMLASEAVTLTPANGFKARSRKAGRAPA